LPQKGKTQPPPQDQTILPFCEKGTKYMSASRWNNAEFNMLYQVVQIPFKQL